MKVLTPNLPTADELLPYIRRIDENKWYSNGGPLVSELESKLNGVCVSSATLGLEIASKFIFKKKEVRIPAFTFPATATALIRSGFDPVLCDVREGDWLMAEIDDQSLPVCTFGVSVNGSLVDAAGAYGNGVTANRVYSLHATKTLPAGEGGVVCGSPELLDYVRKIASFGFENGLVELSGTNAKLSEYHAAVGLASLERFPKIIKRLQEIESRYRLNLSDRFEMQVRAPGAYSIFPVLVSNAEKASRYLTASGIQSRSWYIPTLERHPAFQYLKRESLTVCERLNKELLCLPFHSFLTDSQVDYISEQLCRFQTLKAA